MKYYERIKSLRKGLGMSQEELALKVGMSSKSAISKIENGLRDVSSSKLKRFAIALETTPEYLLTGESCLDTVLVEDEIQLIMKYRQLSKKQKNKVMIDILYELDDGSVIVEGV